MAQFPIHIPTSDLKLSDVPKEDANWHVIGRFALTFDQREADPYSIKNQDFNLITEQTDLVFLRSRLFLEQRRWNHFGRHPDATAINGIRKIISLIRLKLV